MSVTDQPPPLAPEEAFSVLGNETRLRILQVLGEAPDPLSFTELRDRVGLRQGGKFNYHLDKVVGHFVAKSEEGYRLRKAGQRVVEAVVSGAVTDDPVMKPAPIEFDCLLCGTQILVSYRAERLELYCPGCKGQYGKAVKRRESMFPGNHGRLGGYELPPAGVQGRSRRELLSAASLWAHLGNVAEAHGLCPRCGGIIERTIRVCNSHDRSEGLCPACEKRHAIQVDRTCTTCPHQSSGMAVNHLAATLPLRSFVAAQGLDPIAEGFRWGWDYEEEILETDPLRARFRFDIDGATITLTTDGALNVIDVQT